SPGAKKPEASLAVLARFRLGRKNQKPPAVLRLLA
ncbi:hypothetical protein A2U01_0099068, partial [Trifolium medium]|nr:hypothetical protein [Trifolium medium]